MTLVHVQREFGKFSIRQRADDGYFSATDMCKVNGRLWSQYFRMDSTQEYLQALSKDRGRSISQENPMCAENTSALIQVFRGGNQEQGTWIHPEVAIDLAQWCSPEFRVAVNRWVVNWLEAGRAIAWKSTSQLKVDGKELPLLISDGDYHRVYAASTVDEVYRHLLDVETGLEGLSEDAAVLRGLLQDLKTLLGLQPGDAGYGCYSALNLLIERLGKAHTEARVGLEMGQTRLGFQSGYSKLGGR